MSGPIQSSFPSPKASSKSWTRSWVCVREACRADSKTGVRTSLLVESVLFNRDDPLRRLMSEIAISGDHRCVERTSNRSDQRVRSIQVGTTWRDLVRDLSRRNGRPLVDGVNGDPQ